MRNLSLFEPAFTDPFGSALNRFFVPISQDLETRMPKMQIDVLERNGIFEIKADLPGVKKENITVRIDGNVVQIDADINQEKETRTNGGKVLRSERYQGSVSRSFSLAQDVDDSKAKASYADGVLTLELPKKAMSASHRLQIQ
jgi:HSP20 family protein